MKERLAGDENGCQEDSRLTNCKQPTFDLKPVTAGKFSTISPRPLSPVNKENRKEELRKVYGKEVHKKQFDNFIKQKRKIA